MLLRPLRIYCQPLQNCGVHGALPCWMRPRESVQSGVPRKRTYSTVASCVLEMAIMHFRPTPTFLLGGALINVAAYCYNTTGSGKKAGEKLPR